MLLLSTIESIINKGLIVIFGEEVVGWLFGFIVGYLLDYVCMIEGWLGVGVIGRTCIIQLLMKNRSIEW